MNEAWFQKVQWVSRKVWKIAGAMNLRLAPSLAATS